MGLLRSTYIEPISPMGLVMSLITPVNVHNINFLTKLLTN